MLECEKRRTGILSLRTPKARGVSMQLGGMGSAVSSPGGSRRSPAAKRHLVHSWSENALSGKALASWNVCLVKFYRESGPFRSSKKRTGTAFRCVPVPFEDCLCVLYLLKLLTYGHQICSFIPGFTYFSRSQGSQYKNPILDQLGAPIVTAAHRDL